MKLNLFYKLLGFHIVLAIGVYLFRPLALLYFLFTTAFFSYKILKASAKYKSFYVLIACAYVVGVEVFLRMNGGTVFYEASKYLVIVFSVMGILSNGFSRQSLIYVVYIFLLIPGIFVAVSEMGFETNIRKAIAFNLSGPVSLGVAAIFCYRRTVTMEQMKIILWAFLLPLISTTTYLFLYTPDLKEVITSTGSNFAASGGFGPNQVASVLGIGIFVLAVRFFLSKEGLAHKGFDLFLLGLMSFRALATFSRGGVITGVVMILSFLGLYYLKGNLKTKFRIKFLSLIFSGAIIFIWLVSSIQTSGFLDKRYANQDAAGREKEDVTTGRADLLTQEFSEFMDHPFLGVGVGKIKEIRLNETGVEAASHNEMSRIVAEHGLFGLIAFAILLFTPLLYRIRNRQNLFFFSFYFFWFLTINHSAMRIAAPGFIYALSLLNITYKSKNPKNSELKPVS
ncbi:O-antigen ligase family protein [Tamlana sp. 2_MG-2023]|uniref:O-antigen ligase family protein n=1 Tax=unclassified Tamlana TaxID=2614803 RepID=UPI0026E49416|nr:MULTISPECIES: O-antigen ligase family protein [unclassified Tamlana]MDO6758773.1 O-antigen ligase family protein [Tamlana sp. 2_MG-2023]MDO6789472.1 O-antigen ligase family protein [Tamlana sp. 1_MG-2023]